MNHGKQRMMLALLVGLAAMVAVLILLSPASTQAATLIVTSTADDGSSGTLRWCLGLTEAGDTITFDTSVFPATIALDKERGRLPNIDEGNITIDGSGAGVIIDGNDLSSGYDDGFRITSNNNTLIGLTIQNFPSDGVDIRDGAQGNKIQDCVIRSNGKRGVRVAGNDTTGNRITQNSITDNDGSGIVTSDGGNAELAPPIINSVVTDTGTVTVTGFALPGVTVELFTDPGGEGAIFLGSTVAGDKGYFIQVVTGVTLGDDNVTATGTDSSGNTSMFTCYPIPIPSLIWPISGTTTFDGPFSSPFGPRLKASEDYRYDWHRGLDIPVPTGTLAYAVADGWVRCAGDCPGYSDPVIVQVEHEGGCYYCNYLHMLSNTVETDDPVTKGITVGLTGGTESLDHLHFEIRRGGYFQRNAINPFVYLSYTDTLSHAVSISGLYVHTASISPTVTARVVVTAPANELDFNRLALTVADDKIERDWRAVDLHVFNTQKSTIEHPEVLDNPYIDDICIMPARFNKNSDQYRIDFVFYGLQAGDSTTLTAKAADVHSNVASTAVPITASGIAISPAYTASYACPGDVVTYTHVLSNSSGTSRTFSLSATSAQSWTAQVSPPSVSLDGGGQPTVTVTAYITVPTGTPCGRTDCTVVTASDDTDGTIQAIAVDVTRVRQCLFLPVVMKDYAP